jgi:hypothetical protein
VNLLLIAALICLLSALAPAGAALADDSMVHRASPAASAPEPTRLLKVRLSWGHETRTARPFQIRLLANEVAVRDLSPVGFEPGDTLRDGVAETRAGAGDVDGLDFILAFPERAAREIPNLQTIWACLLAHSDADTVRHPREKPLRASTVNGQEWKDFDPAKEWVRIPHPKPGTSVVTARY